jgi:hypothetical protein
MLITSVSVSNHDTQVPRLTHFQSQFTGAMQLYADAQSVADYLNAHPDWFRRCAQPMKVEPLGERGYALTVGRYGSLGYEIEPQIGLELLPPDEQGVYRILTIPVPGHEPQGYQVDFRAALQLMDTPTQPLEDRTFTQVEWHLDLKISIQFPKFIYRLPQAAIQQTGDRLLKQVVRQISQRLMATVAADFHATLATRVPPIRSGHP